MSSAAMDTASAPGASTKPGTHAALKLSDVRHGFGSGATRLDVLRGIDFEIGRGELVALVGPSGAGKSTLLHICGLLEAPQQGQVLLFGRDCSKFGDTQRTQMRRHKIGFVYQFHNLLPEFSALENVIIPQLISGRDRAEAEKRAYELLKHLGLSERVKHRPAELSGGEQQRVAIARAVANGPGLLLADEPTGNLDPKTAAHTFALLVKLVRAAGLSALIATHNLQLASEMDRCVTLEDGVLQETNLKT